MKKALAMALGALLVAGSAAPAFAAGKVDISGYLRVYNANDWNANFGTSDTKVNESYFVNQLNLDFVFKATDEVSFYWTLRAPDEQRWTRDGDRNSVSAETVHIYGEVEQDWGTISIGRLAGDFSYFGLATLDWNPGGVNDDWTDWGVFDFDEEWDGIRYANRWDNGFQLVAQFNRWDDDHDGRNTQTTDLFALQPSFHWDDGGASLALMYLRDHVQREDDGTSHSDAPASKTFYINPALAHSFGDFSVHFEGMAGWSNQEVPDDDDEKANGYGLYLDFDYNYGPGNVMLAGWWASGTGEDDEDSKGLVDMGGAFAPFLVAYGDTGWRRSNGDGAVARANERSANGDEGTSNHWAIALAGGHALTDDITLKYGVGYMALNKVAEDKKNSIGAEIDLGLEFKLLDNLEFRTTAGYLLAGDALKENEGDSVKDAFAWYNTLTLTFDY